MSQEGQRGVSGDREGSLETYLGTLDTANDPQGTVKHSAPEEKTQYEGRGEDVGAGRHRLTQLDHHAAKIEGQGEDQTRRALVGGRELLGGEGDTAQSR